MSAEVQSTKNCRLPSLTQFLTDEIQSRVSQAENVAPQQQFSHRRSCSYLEYAGPRTNLTYSRSTVPTNDQILVPETLLKKRKSQEKARAERTDAIKKRKAVSFFFPPSLGTMMHNISIN